MCTRKQAKVRFQSVGWCWWAGVVAFVWGWLGVLQLLSSLSRVHINEPRWCVVHTDASRATSTWRHKIHATVER